MKFGEHGHRGGNQRGHESRGNDNAHRGVVKQGKEDSRQENKAQFMFCEVRPSLRV